VFVAALLVLGAIVGAGFFLLARSPETAEDRTATSETSPAVPGPRFEGPARLVLAARWRRLVARIIDSFLLSIVVYIVLIAAVIGTIRDSGRPTLEAVRHAGLVADIASLAVASVYEVVLVGTIGQTIGKVAMRIRVVRAADASQPGFGTALMRWMIQVLAPVVAAAPFGFRIGGSAGATVMLLLAPIIVYGGILYDGKRQGAHDKAAGTVVIDARYAARRKTGTVISVPQPHTFEPQA
jgi:uncharacterized RDD family membrane protein YckC